MKALLASKTDRVEWKQSAKDTSEVLRAVCALANDLGDAGTPGHVLVGVAKDGRPVGVDTSDAALQSLASKLTSTKILPNPSCSIEAADLGGVSVLVVTVQPYPVPPAVSVDGVTWVRVGTTTRRASSADVQRLQERRPEHARPFDTRPCPGARLDDLDVARLRAEHEAAREVDSDVESFPELARWLAQRGLARWTGTDHVPTVAAVLVWGLDPLGLVPGASVEFARFAGRDFDAEVVARRTLTGSLPDQLEGLWAQLSANNTDVLAGEEGPRTVYAPSYPPEALRELGYVERLGRGVRRVRALLERNGNPPLEVDTDGFTTVTVRRRP